PSPTILSADMHFPISKSLHTTCAQASTTFFPRSPPFFFQAEDGIRDRNVTGVQTCALPISNTCGRTMNTRPGPSAASIFSEAMRSEERRVGKECRSRWSKWHYKKRMILSGLTVKYKYNREWLSLHC